MTLVTADPQRAFLTIDSGFPLLDLEEALQKAAPFVYAYGGSAVPVLFAPADWKALARANGQTDGDLVESLLYEADLARLYWALSRIDPETRADVEEGHWTREATSSCPGFGFLWEPDLYSRRRFGRSWRTKR